jgi:rhomboid protease GluP
VDLNHILLFVALSTSLIVLARAWRPSAGIYRGWRVSSLVVLAITGISWLFFRKHAGFIGGGAWFALLFLPVVGLRKVTELATRRRYAAARRLATALQIVHPSAELRDQIQLFRALESGQTVGFDSGIPPRPVSERRRTLRGAPVVGILILLNAAVFLLEIYSGGADNDNTLHRLGALDPYSVVILKQYGRLLTALFLHAGAAHLLFNVFALYVLGPGLERTIGSLRFAAVYLISGIGSSIGVVTLMVFRVIHAALVVGASGCVMGIVGAWAGFLLRHRHAPRARERLMNILLIIVIQTAFDLTTPQVSTAAHVCGLLSGFLAGLFLRAKRAAPS